MTPLTKSIRRRATSQHPDARKTRAMVVTLTPEPLPSVEIRPARHRRGVSIPLDSLYDILVCREAEMLRREKAKAKKEKRKWKV